MPDVPKQAKAVRTRSGNVEFHFEHSPYPEASNEKEIVHMRPLTKVLLALLIVNTVASVLFMTGIVDVSSVPSFYLALPLAAIFYGMFVICLVMNKEVAAFDAEQRLHHDHAGAVNHPHNIESLHDHDHPESIAA